MNDQIPKIPKFFAIPFVVVLIGLTYFTITNFSPEYTLFYALGYLFTLGPILIFFGLNNSSPDDSTNTKKSKIKNNSIIVGLFFTLISLASLLVTCVDNNTYNFSITYIYSHLGFYTIIPIAMLVLGIFMVISGINDGSKSPKLIVAKVIKIDHNNSTGEYTIVFSDDLIDNNSPLASVYKYFVYKTKSGEIFKENETYQFNLYKYGKFFSVMPIEEFNKARILSSFNNEDFY